MLLAAGYDPPHQLFVHGYLELDNQKISKSLGNAIDPLDLIDTYGPDPVRYWIARAISFGHDGDATVDGVRERYDSELANDLGNLLSRTTAMVARYRDGTIRQVDPDTPVDFDALREDVAARFDRFDVTGAIDAIWDCVRKLNQYVSAEAPWQLAKDDANAERLDRVLYTLVDGLTALAVALWPYLPQTSPKILAALGQPADPAWERVAGGRVPTTEGIEPAEPLFPRIEVPA
jgi:methionyl-tRNA synthetase